MYERGQRGINILLDVLACHASVGGAAALASMPTAKSAYGNHHGRRRVVQTGAVAFVVVPHHPVVTHRPIIVAGHEQEVGKESNLRLYASALVHQALAPVKVLGLAPPRFQRIHKALPRLGDTAGEGKDARFQLASMEEFLGIVNKDDLTRHTYVEDAISGFTGKLLLIQGMVFCDPPVFRLVEALQKANKDVDMPCLPNLMTEITSYTRRREWDYLVKHLQGVEPPKEFSLVTHADLL